MFHEHEILEELRYLREEMTFIRSELWKILHLLRPHHHYSITIHQEDQQMAITVGATGTFAAQLEDNGNPIPLPTGSTFAWSADDTSATLAPSTDTLSVVVTVPATDTATSVTITAETVDPAGQKVAGSLQVPIIPAVAHTFTIKVTQTA